MKAETLAAELTKRLSSPCEQLTNQLLHNCHEFEPADLQRLRSGATSDEIAAALIPLWTDLRYVHAQPDLLVKCAVANTASVLAGVSALGDPLLQELLARVFDALVAQPPHLDLRAPALNDFCNVIIAVCREHQNDWNLGWIPLANSCVSIWPSTFDTVFGCLSVQSPAVIPFIAYVVALAYQTPDHPWSKQGVLLWQRLGEIEIPTWGERPAQRLLEVLDVNVVRSHLLALPRSVPVPSGDYGISGPLIDELVSLQLDTDYPRRCVVLARNLQTRARQLVWDDEWGITGR